MGEGPPVDRPDPGEEVAALTAATWVLARDTGFPVEERILFARLCRWARRIAWANAEKANWRAKQEAKQRLASTLSGSKTAPVRVPTPEAAPVAVKKRPCALEYGDDLPEHPRTLRIWLFHAYRKRLEWLVCHHREELAFRLKKETVHCWIFFPPGGTHRLRWRIRGEEAAALKAATWMLKRDPRFLAEERVLFARLFGWAQRVARHDAQMGELNSEREAKNRLNWTPVTRKQRGGFRPGTDQKT